jgi:hypothetical protein
MIPTPITIPSSRSQLYVNANDNIH